MLLRVHINLEREVFSLFHRLVEGRAESLAVKLDGSNLFRSCRPNNSGCDCIYFLRYHQNENLDICIYTSMLYI